MPSSEVIELVLSWIVTNGLTFLVVLVDERRLDEERLERAWPPSSRNAAIIGFGLVAVPIHFARTRGHFGSARGVLGRILGLALGLVVATIVAIVASLLIDGIMKVIAR